VYSCSFVPVKTLAHTCEWRKERGRPGKRASLPRLYNVISEKVRVGRLRRSGMARARRHCNKWPKAATMLMAVTTGARADTTNDFYMIFDTIANVNPCNVSSSDHSRTKWNCYEDGRPPAVKLSQIRLRIRSDSTSTLGFRGDITQFSHKSKQSFGTRSA